jgi:16S rRNA C967 or C1407 C5-methylase (RsmB/RsmF family)
MLHEENRGQIDAFLARTPGWVLESEKIVLTGVSSFDSFYGAVLKRG